ncbi:MAG: hypothetical protein KDK70_14980 [Myxococcales bacterium]|nr:hypothetical protein [Myxococcales bacterium]
MKIVRNAIKYARTRLWEQLQYPDPDVVYQRQGIFGITHLLSVTGNKSLANELLARYGADIHPECWPIGPQITIHEAPVDYRNLSIGAHAHIGKQVFLDLTEQLIIEESVGVGMRAILLTHNNIGAGYRNKPMTRLYPKKHKPTILRRGCSIGAGAIIAAGVEVGEDALVNAGALVDRSVPPRTIVHCTRQRAPLRVPDRFFDKPAPERER